MKRQLIIALRVTAVTLVLTGLLYPLAITAISRVVFPWRASGSLVQDDRGRVVGSELLAQGFKSPAYFQPRPSAAGDGYDATASGGSNLGPTSAKLRDRVNRDVARLQKENPDAPGPVPDELVTASASGLDPHLTPRAALWQVPRIAAARGIPEVQVQRMVTSMKQDRDLGVLGEPRVNVLALNLALDRQYGRPIPQLPQSGGPAP